MVASGQEGCRPGNCLSTFLSFREPFEQHLKLLLSPPHPPLTGRLCLPGLVQEPWSCPRLHVLVPGAKLQTSQQSSEGCGCHTLPILPTSCRTVSLARLRPHARRYPPPRKRPAGFGSKRMVSVLEQEEQEPAVPRRKEEERCCWSRGHGKPRPCSPVWLLAEASQK